MNIYKKSLVINRSFWTILGILFSAQVFGQSPIDTDRPTQSESAVVLPKNIFQVESGFGVSYSGETNQRIREISMPNVLMRLNLVKGFELRLIANHLQQYRPSNNQQRAGIADWQVGSKIQLFSSPKAQMAFSTHLIFPTGSARLSNGQIGTLNRLLFAHPIGVKQSISYNIGYNNYGTGSGDLIYTLSLAHQVNDKFIVFLEPYGDWQEFSNAEVSFNAGFLYRMKIHMQWDFSLGTGLNHTMNFLSTGFSWALSPKEKESTRTYSE